MIVIRNYILGEALPWAQKEIGCDSTALDPEFTWVAFEDGRMVGFLAAAKVMHSLLLLRLLGGRSGRDWLPQMWKMVRSACDNHAIAGWWTLIDNETATPAEQKLVRLLRSGKSGTKDPQSEVKPTLWLKGRF